MSEDVAFVAGFRIASNRALPGLPDRGDGDLCLDVRFGPASGTLPRVPAQAHPLRSFVELDGWLSGDGRRAFIVEPMPAHFDVASAIRRVLPFASALQGRVVLHASAVAMQRDVHAFVGASGAGKSTLAGLLRSRGAVPYADDLLPCRAENGHVVALSPGGGADGRSAGRLCAVHFLARSTRIARASVRRMRPVECMERLLWNGFGELAEPSVWATQFEFYALIAREVAAYELTVPNDVARLDATADEVGSLLAALDAGAAV